MTDRFDLTIASIFRDSCGYLPRYLAQVDGVLRACGPAHVVWLEGDSRDGTRVKLSTAAAQFTARYGAEVTLTQFDVGGPYWPSIDHGDRWKQLSTCWNENLKHITPSKHVMFVEADLIWDVSAVWYLIDDLKRMDVAYAALFHQSGSYYDTHSHMTNGQHWTVNPPFYPAEAEVKDGRYVPVESAGGLIMTSGETFGRACQGWSEDGCVLQFGPNATQYVDLEVRAIHP
jgi:hypothetical protein